jgi:hypothetical protein
MCKPTHTPRWEGRALQSQYWPWRHRPIHYGVLMSLGHRPHAGGLGMVDDAHRWHCVSPPPKPSRRIDEQEAISVGTRILDFSDVFMAISLYSFRDRYRLLSWLGVRSTVPERMGSFILEYVTRFGIYHGTRWRQVPSSEGVEFGYWFRDDGLYAVGFSVSARMNLDRATRMTVWWSENGRCYLDRGTGPDKVDKHGWVDG